ncbi:MAG TPA: CRISPR-associated helicase Cas3' [Clostridiaceae bacterium]|nr:CRISPR-associated helicase Cas3' [Clostridiaceae bacterium]
MYIARKREDGEVQPLIVHLQSTAQIAKTFAKAFNEEEYAYICGLFHDLGKYSEEFQKRITSGGKKCDHSTAGAKEVVKLNGSGKLLAYCIAGHHSGLLNAGFHSDNGNEATLNARLKKEIPDYKNAFKEVNLSAVYLPKVPKIKPLTGLGFSLSFFIRMIYSCLVDADFLDTEKFMTDGKVNRKVNYNFDLFLQKLNGKLASFDKKGRINEVRNKILYECIKKAELERGIFTLTVPTGGGKTLSSLAFAINHLIKNKMDRIIYVIPYTSIIEQNAKIFEDILGKGNVLEHHSNFDFSSVKDDNENNDEDDVYNILKLSSENWDIPVIVTTNVQFFESLFANKSSRCRKLHNISNSVIIFDEAQMLPIDYLKPCIMAISELVINYNSTVVLCTATQPALGDIFPKEVTKKIKIQEICENNVDIKSVFRRTKVVKRGVLDLQSLANEINRKHQVLCIVNTRKHAYELFSKLDKECSYHLSTLMCPNHRRDTIAEIKDRLAKGQTCRVASTRLIEAGVDVDFPFVYRSVAGLDSIIQAAGRCNREGKLKDENGNLILGEVHVFTPESRFSQHQPNSFKGPIRITEGIIRRYEDIFSDEAIFDYFKELYEVLGEESLDIKDICKELESGVYIRPGKPVEFNFNFKDIADKFKLIEEDTYPIIIPYTKNGQDKKVGELINSLRYSEYISSVIQALQGYTINVYKSEFDWLLGVDKLEHIRKDIFILKDMSIYDNKTGLRITKESGIGIYI